MPLHVTLSKIIHEVRLQRIAKARLRTNSRSHSETRTPRTATFIREHNRHAYYNQQLQRHRKRFRQRPAAYSEVLDKGDGDGSNVSRFESDFSRKIPSRRFRTPVTTVPGKLRNMPRLQTPRHQNRERETLNLPRLQRVRCEVLD